MSAPTMTVKANSIETATSNTVAGAGGFVAGSGNSASAACGPTVKSYLLDGTTLTLTGNLTISALATDTATTSGLGVTVGAVAIGVTISKATDSAHVSAYAGTGTLNLGGTLTISAAATNTALASGNASGGGFLSGDGADVDATINPDNTAYANGVVTVSGNASITASETDHADAEAMGIIVAGLAVGAMLADSEVTENSGKSTSAYVGQGAQLSAANLTVQGNQIQDGGGDPTAKANASASAGSLVGIIATRSTANTAVAVNAYVGNNSNITVPGNITIEASDNTLQQGYVSGKQGALLAVGSNNVNVSSNDNTNAYTGNYVTISDPTGTLHIGADGNDNNYAQAVSGSGGIISGVSTKATTTTTSQTTAAIGQGSGQLINVNTLQISATHTATINSKVNSINAAVVGASGGYAVNNVYTTVQANVGAGASVLAYNITITATSNTNKPSLNDNNVTSGSGGAIDIAAAESDTSISNNTSVNVGDGATLHEIGDYFNPGDFHLIAINNISAVDTVKLDDGGLITAPSGTSTIIADTDNATVNIGTGATAAPLATLRNDAGEIDLVAYSNSSITANADVKTYGLAGLGAGELNRPGQGREPDPHRVQRLHPRRPERRPARRPRHREERAHRRQLSQRRGLHGSLQLRPDQHPLRSRGKRGGR